MSKVVAFLAVIFCGCATAEVVDEPLFAVQFSTPPKELSLFMVFKDRAVVCIYRWDEMGANFSELGCVSGEELDAHLNGEQL